MGVSLITFCPSASGKVFEIFENNFYNINFTFLTLWPSFALVSTYTIPKESAFFCPSSVVTCLINQGFTDFYRDRIYYRLKIWEFLDRYILLRHQSTSLYFRMIVDLLVKVLLVMSNTTRAAEASRMYPGTRLRNRSCPAVSQSCKRTWLNEIYTVRSSKYMVFDKKSIPIVA